MHRARLKGGNATQVERQFELKKTFAKHQYWHKHVEEQARRILVWVSSSEAGIHWKKYTRNIDLYLKASMQVLLEHFCNKSGVARFL